MLARERRDRLLELVRMRSFASLPELAEHLDVSESTVRRDLEQLESDGMPVESMGGFFTRAARQNCRISTPINRYSGKKRRRLLRQPLP